MNFKIFIDESGDHGLKCLDESFPVFVLCGVLFSEDDYFLTRLSLNAIKNDFWGTDNVVFHSSDIRRCRKEFSILLDTDVKARFYGRLDSVMDSSNYVVFASCVKKDEFLKRFGRSQRDIYSFCLSMLIERVVFHLDRIRVSDKNVEIIVEKRGKREDSLLKANFNSIRMNGTYYVKPERILALGMDMSFSDKKENLNGIQFADLIAYPIARYVMDKARANPAFDMISKKIYSVGKSMHGLKVLP